jgi:hypothetical protein
MPTPDPATPRGAPRQLSAESIADFVRDELLSPARRRPVVALTTQVRPTRLHIDAARLAADLAAHAEVVVLETGEATWALSAVLPPRLDVFGGAARIWWPGLARDSDPRAHPLLFVFDTSDAVRVEARIRATILDGDARVGSLDHRDATTRRAPASGPGPAPEASPAAESASADHAAAVLVEVGEHAVQVRVDGASCVVDPQDCPPEDVSADIRPGHELRVRRTDRTLQGMPVVEVRGVPQDPWRRLTEVYEVGDVVRGRVCRVEAGYVLVELLPGAALIAKISELDWNFVRSPADLFEEGSEVKALILSLEPERHRGTLSIKRAYTEAALPPVSPGLGQPPFLGGEGDAAWDTAERVAEEPSRLDAVDEDAALLQRELDAALQDRAELMAANRAQKEQLAELRRELRSLEDRLRDVQARVSADLDPTESEVAFLKAVRVAYARRFDEGERQRYPLARMRVGREFLARWAALEGVSLEKVLDVCAEVACLRAHEIPAREVHPLRFGAPGAPVRVRVRDGARAWRCSLQDGTPSARRLHWWDVPGKDGRVIEFASVGVHDDMGIPD